MRSPGSACYHARMSYERSTYQLRRFELVAPRVTNDRTVSDYPARVRESLQAFGFEGWTEVETHSYWLGKVEPGVTFVIFAEDERAPDWSALPIPTADILARIARSAMPDQDAVQLVIGDIVTLREV